MCIRCDGPPQPAPITFDQWLNGEGGEEAVQRFSADLATLRSGNAAPEQVERMRYAFAEET